MDAVITNIRWGSVARLSLTSEASDMVLDAILCLVLLVVYRIWKLDSQKRQQRESVEASTLPRDEPQFGAAWRRFCQLYVRDGKTDISKTRIEWGTRRPRVRRRGFRLTKVAYIVSAGLELEDEGETEEQEDEIRKRILEKGQQRTW